MVGLIDSSRSLKRESDSLIFKMTGARPGFKNFGTEAESESEKVTPATSGLSSLSRCFNFKLPEKYT